jgi:single-strand DNA-binding protein
MSTIYLTVPGRIATKPERFGSGKNTGARFRVATTERWFDRSAEEWNDAQPVYLSVKCWRQLGDNVLLSLRIGDPVVVHGKLVNSSFERDGHIETRLEINAAAVGPDLRWSTAAVTRTRSAAADAPAGAGPDGNGGRLDDVSRPIAARGRPGEPTSGAEAPQRPGVLAGEGAVRA